MDKLTWRKNGQGEPELDVSREVLRLKTVPNCDFWCTPSGKKTNGCFGAISIEGDFQMSVRVKGSYEHQYDQAGMMVYLGEEHWLKAGLELVNDIPHISAVVTNKFSDWSLVPITSVTKSAFINGVLNLRIERQGSKILIDYCLDSQSLPSDEEVWVLLRKVTCFFPEGYSGNFEVGLMAASPQSKTGFSVEFSAFTLTQL